MLNVKFSQHYWRLSHYVGSHENQRLTQRNLLRKG